MTGTCGGCPFFNKGQPQEPGQHMGVCSKAPKGERMWRRDDQDVCPPMTKTTLNRIWWPLLMGPSVVTDHCVVCGKTWPLNQHHPVRRSAGNLFGWDGKAVEKPTLTLCGSGNASGCHGLAHSMRLHFRFEDGEWRYLMTQEPESDSEAFRMEGWTRIRD